MINLDIVRTYYPYLQTGKIYFNHAAISPFSSLIIKRINDYLLERSLTHIEDYDNTEKTILSAKSKIGKMINTLPDRIAFLDNTSNGLNIIAQGIKWEHGDRIILNDIEFPSNVYPFLNLRAQGVEIDFVKSRNGIVRSEDIISAIKPTTKLISISSVQFLSGYRADLEMIGEICKKNNIIFSVDAIQELGALRLDVQKCNIDFLACGTQKWLMGLQGLAFVYISEILQDSLSHKFVGWTSVENPWTLLNYDLVLKKSADAFQNGTISIIGVHGLDEALGLFLSLGLDNIESQILNNTTYLMTKLREKGIEPVLHNCTPDNLSGIVTIKPQNPKKVFDNLSNRNIICSLREGMIRFSPHYYNTTWEIDTVVESVSE
ncbi:MAG: aminotransferase class V-fold PLP-dependent enzyme [Ignavibacteriales bacterium]|jgi:selenocysteine lyase/cysteine desulfurase|nr:aminotransferase class V-fold PLP-dependent enzyme [Ignavibacteriaceae bacterium]NLH61382.1 aminotransferase class V-fold PLP-dependent enzyme [Ignavibacteriales bacterium]HOJ17084.1 aminotransferase class V-fold PLP-dependent enzyme [Ignavibacteriaceae bacterium]HPO56544.1 aminotransferase class V-fold PLP-dependent enzyme [Ignavibacteriaceae bacterium]